MISALFFFSLSRFLSFLVLSHRESHKTLFVSSSPTAASGNFKELSRAFCVMLKAVKDFKRRSLQGILGSTENTVDEDFNTLQVHFNGALCNISTLATALDKLDHHQRSMFKDATVASQNFNDIYSGMDASPWPIAVNALRYQSQSKQFNQKWNQVRVLPCPDHNE